MIDPVSGAASVNTIQIKLKPGANLTEIRDQLLAKYPPSYFPFMVQTWQDQQRPLLSAVNLELTILNILLFLIIAVAGFGILATFFMIVVEKTKDIGVLKALGAPSQGVMSIFLGYGVSLGAVGTGVGISLGLLFVLFINDIANGIQWLTGQEIFDPTIYYFSEIPTIVSPLMVVLVAIERLRSRYWPAFCPHCGRRDFIPWRHFVMSDLIEKNAGKHELFEIGEAPSIGSSNRLDRERNP